MDNSKHIEDCPCAWCEVDRQNAEIRSKRDRRPTGTEREVCNDITIRQQLGIAKYGKTVAENPLTLWEWLRHAYEECLDQAVYLKRAISEIDSPVVSAKVDPKRMETPETDAVRETWLIKTKIQLGDGRSIHGNVVDVEFARNLERQRNAALSDLQYSRGLCEVLGDRVRGMESELENHGKARHEAECKYNELRQQIPKENASLPSPEA